MLLDGRNSGAGGGENKKAERKRKKVGDKTGFSKTFVESREKPFDPMEGPTKQMKESEACVECTDAPAALECVQCR